MKQVLILLVVLWVGFSTAVEKPGKCRSSSSITFGACVITCGEDSDCKDFTKCCFNGCGQICQEPVCPEGVSKVSCPASLCSFSQCPNAPDALCRIDSCGQCKVEYYNKTTWEKVACTNTDKHLCERMRDFGNANPLPGRYVPTCNSEGKFGSTQRRGSVLFCVDEETGVPDLETGTSIGTGKPNCAKKEKTLCQLAIEKAMKFPPIGRFMPQCKEDGSYEDKQCHGSSGFCWCVDEKGREWFGSRQRGVVECPKSMCPGDAKQVEGCDPMICATASCPGYKKSEVSCRVNPCGQCKAEFLDKYHRNVTCKTCAVTREKRLRDTRGMVGGFVPQCDVTGNYNRMQCWGSTGYCWCVDQLRGRQVDGTKIRGTPECKPRTLLLGSFPGVGATTKAPARGNVPVCPNGFPMLLCLRGPFCRGSSCAANTAATCQVNPCRMCAVEYFDKDNKLVDCKKEMTDCQLKRADAFSSKHIGLQPVGRFIPKCEANGDYSPVQCWGSIGYCWCVDGKTGVEQEMTRVRGTPNCAIKTNATMSVNKTEVKKGRCPTIRPTDTCDKKCANDEECPGKDKCCEIGCGKTCRKPAEHSLACPNGSPFLLCFRLCQLATCPAHPDAKCSSDPCRFCKVEFKDSQGNVVNCTENLTPCELQKAGSPALLGIYRAQCEDDGRYKPVQCHGSTGYCWCVDENGQEINNTRQVVRGPLVCDAISAKTKGLSKCQQMRTTALASGLLGAKTPQCEDDGRFKQIQTGEGYRWCVDDNGIELLGTRKTPGSGTPDCKKACSPVMCMMYCQYGFLKDPTTGCEICKCALAPYKPGVCPTSAPTINVDCTEDLDCPGSMKCCEKKCNFPLNYVKPGYCPRLMNSSVGDCESECSRDSDCSNNEKCCAKGCNRACMAPARQVCPNGAPLVMCLRNMCDQNAVCSAHPEATCRMNYCGHCSTEFVFSNGTIATCGDSNKKYNDKVECASGKNKTLLFCSQSLCNDVKCAKNPKATCEVPIVSCDCTPLFVDRDGERVDCLTECQKKKSDVESGPSLLGVFKPRCEEDGRYSRRQCHGSAGYCWCVSDDGTKWPGTSVHVPKEPDCSDENRPEIGSVHVQLSFNANFDTIKDNLDDFKMAFIELMKTKLGVHHEQINDFKVSSGSIIVDFILLKHEDGQDVRNVSSSLRSMVIEGEFVFEYGGQTMVATPESYSAALKIRDDEEDESSSSAVLAITLGVVFALLAVLLVIGVIVYLRKRRAATRDSRGMSVNTCDSSMPLHK